ncbi:MAG: S-layer homology domain-containing protein [Deltaproteobacteria bacterium]
MARLRHNIWLYLLLMVFVFGLTAQAAGEDPKGATTKFNDVGATDKNAVFINYVTQRGFISGFPDGTFHPSDGLTRAQAATVMVKAAGLKTGDTTNLFKDVASSHWAAAYISAASKAGYISGFPDGTFHPDQKLTRAQAMSMLMRLCTVKTSDQLPVLEDMDSKHWAAPAMASALAAGMTGTSEDGKKAYPDAELSRSGLARALAILMTKDPGLYQTPLYGTVTDIVGSVSITRNGINSVVKEDSRLSQGDSLITGKNSSARINYPDGSSTLMDAESEIYVKSSSGRAYIKMDGSPGIAVDFLNVDLKKGTLFGALATKHDTGGSTKEQAAKPAILAALPSFKLAAQNQAAPWYKSAEAKKVKVKVDMPWGVAAVRGTFIRVTVNQDGTCKVSCLTGSAELTGGSGDSVALGGGQSSSIDGEGQAANGAGSFSADDKDAFDKVQQWAVDVALIMDECKAANETKAILEMTVEVPDEQESEATVKVIVDALKSSGIELNDQVIKDLKDQIEGLKDDGDKDDDQNKDQNNNNDNNGDNVISAVNYNTAGVFGPESSAGTLTIAGNANILVAGVTLRNMVITGNLILGAGIGDGDVTLSNVTVNGTTYVYGGGSSSVHLDSCSLVNVIVDRDNNIVRLVASGSTSVGALVLNSGVTLEENGLSGTAAGFSSVATGIDLPAGAQIVLCGNFDALSVTVPGLNIQVEGGSINQVSIGQSAAGTSLTLEAGSSVGLLSVNAAASVGGSGTISSATISVAGVTMAQTPASLQVAPGVSANVGGSQVIGTSTNNAPSTPIITMTPDPSTSITTSTQVTITASSTDPDRDAVTYVWSGRIAETSTYPLGKQVVTVTAVDEHGMASEAAAVVFVVTNGATGSQSTGGMKLEGPESRIYEHGIAGGNITKYTFNVPMVSGHYGQDYAWVKGLNVNTQQWDTLDFAYTDNGISFSRVIASGAIYSRLEFYYYTDHTCMYDLSNIVYSVDYAFGNISDQVPAEAAPVASNVTVVGENTGNGTTLVGCYDFSDANGDREQNVIFGWYNNGGSFGSFTNGTSLYQWYVSNEQAGLNKQPINGATARTYSVAAGDTNYYFFQVTPVALSGLTGTLTGSPVFSSGTSLGTATNQLASEITAVSSAGNTDLLLKELHRLNLNNVVDDRKAFYWTEQQKVPVITTLSNIQTNIVDAGNTNANIPRASGLRIYTGTGQGGNVSSQVMIFVVDQFGWDFNTQVAGVTVSVSGGTIASVTNGTITSGSVGDQQITLNTDASGTIVLTLSMDPSVQTTTVNAASPASESLPALAAHPRTIVVPVLSGLQISMPNGEPTPGLNSALIAVFAKDQNGNNYFSIIPNVQVTVAGGTSKIASVYTIEGNSCGTVTAGDLGSQAVTFSTSAQGILAFNLTLDAPADQTVTINATNGTLTAVPLSVIFHAPVDITSSAFTMLANNNTVTITLGGGTFKAGPITAADFSFSGTDAAALAAGTFTRVSDTIVTISGLSGRAGTDNTVTVKAATMATQAYAVSIAASTVCSAVTSQPFTMLANNNTVTITLTGGTFKAAPITAADFSFSGTDAAALALGTFTRVSDTEVTITNLSNLSGTDNTITVYGTTQATQASSVSGAASTVYTALTSPWFTFAEGDNTVTITLTGGTFKPSPISAADFAFYGDNGTKLAAGTYNRVSDTIVTITGLSGLSTVTDNAVEVYGATQATQATAVAAAGSPTI